MNAISTSQIVSFIICSMRLIGKFVWCYVVETTKYWSVKEQTRNNMLYCPLWFPHKNDVRFVFTSSYCRRAHVLFTLFVFVCILFCPVSLDCPFFIAPSVFSNIYFIWIDQLVISGEYWSVISHGLPMIIEKFCFCEG